KRLRSRILRLREAAGTDNACGLLVVSHGRLLSVGVPVVREFDVAVEGLCPLLDVSLGGFWVLRPTDGLDRVLQVLTVCDWVRPIWHGLTVLRHTLSGLGGVVLELFTLPVLVVATLFALRSGAVRVERTIRPVFVLFDDPLVDLAD